MRCEMCGQRGACELKAGPLLWGAGQALHRFGLEVPEISPNYSQTIKFEGVADLGYAARVVFVCSSKSIAWQNLVQRRLERNRMIFAAATTTPTTPLCVP
jgi:hypothetical protein